MQASKLVALTLVALLGATGCSEVTQAPTDVPAPAPDPEPPPPPAAEPEPCFKIDFLFVVDDSGSMGQEQSNLVQNFPKFLEVIDNYINSAGSYLDYRLAVTTTGVATPDNPDPYGDPMSGAFRNDCGIDRPWVERKDFSIEDAFTCRMNVGTGGPATELPVTAIEYAFSDRMDDGTNGDFLREDALLAIIVLTDEDDCANYNGELADSSCHEDMQGHIDFLDDLKGERSKWAMSVIAGEMDCDSSFGNAIEATRLKDLIAKTGDNGIFSSICEGDLSPALTDALDTFSAACENFGPIE